MIKPGKDSERYQNEQDMKVSRAEQDFEFAIQDGFDGTPGSIVAGDSITVGTEAYRVETIERDQSGTIFTVRCAVKTARQLQAA
jgi:hypothetical protein